jgi:outer membrane protein insertion porin family
MRGVSTGTGGRRTACGRCRSLLCAGLALAVLLLHATAASAQDSSGDQPAPNQGNLDLSNRTFLQDGQQTSPNSGKKKQPQPADAASEEKRIADLIAQREREREGTKIIKVLVEGNTTIPSEAILQKIKTQTTRPATNKQIQDDVATLWKTRWFYTVTPKFRNTPQGVILVFVVIERPIVRSVEYVGNVEMKTKKLEAQTGLRAGSPYDVNANKEAATRLEDYYHKEDFPDATVALEKGGKREERDVVFRIYEGKKQKVLWRSFEGNNAFSGDLLAMQLKSTPAYGGLIGGHFDPANLPEDVAAIRNYYQNLGYFDARVEPNVRYSDNHKWIYLVYIIHEGLRYHIRNFAITGNTRFMTDELMKEIKVRDGQYYNLRLLNKDVLALKKKYGLLGYFYINIEMIPRFLEQPGQIDLVMRIDEDRIYRIRKITPHIDGDHSRTQRAVALNYIGIAPGDPADPAKVEKSKKLLSGAQVFKGATDPTSPGVKVVAHRVTDKDDADPSPSVRGQSDDSGADEPWFQPPVANPLVNLPPLDEPPPTKGPQPRDPYLDPDLDNRWTDDVVVIRGQSPDDPFNANPFFNPSPQGDPFARVARTPNGEIDLDYYLSEERTGRLMFGVGVNSSAGLVGSVVLQEQNFDIMRPPTSWDDFLDGTAWRGAGQRFRVELMPGIEMSRYTVSWQDPFFMNSPYTLGVSGYYSQYYYQNWTEDRVGGRINFGRQLSPEWSVNGQLRLEGVRVADPTVPTPPILEEAVGDSFLSTVKGSIIYDTRDMPFMAGEGHRVELSYEQAFGEFNYPRPMLNASQYFTIWQRPDGGGRQILQLSGQMGWTGNDTPIFERFFAGGFDSFRGFYFRGVSPETEGVYYGGQWMAVGTIQYSIPLMANEMIRMVFFSDFGTVQDSVGFDQMRVSVGTGFRISLPMMGPVPLAFDFGIPVLKQPTDETQVFSFYVGLTR